MAGTDSEPSAKGQGDFKASRIHPVAVVEKGRRFMQTGLTS